MGKAAIDTIRKIEAADYHHGYAELFSVLTHCTPLKQETFTAILQEREAQGWHTWVLEDRKHNKTRLIATTSLLLERKIYRNGMYVGHIEDVIVLPEYQHQNIGTAFVAHAVKEAKKLGCYKAILDCKPNLEQFYTQSGMELKNIQMAYYFDDV